MKNPIIYEEYGSEENSFNPSDESQIRERFIDQYELSSSNHSSQSSDPQDEIAPHLMQYFREPPRVQTRCIPFQNYLHTSNKYSFGQPSTKEELALCHEQRAPPIKRAEVDSFASISSCEPLSLITIPEPPGPNRRSKKMKRDISVRFAEAKLNFMDSFLPCEMKLKNNPYNLFKYIQRKKPLSQ